MDRPDGLLPSVTAERREALTDEDVPAVLPCGGAPPLDADLEQVRPVDLVQPRLDLYLWQRDVEALADELLDPLEVVGVVADEDRVGWLWGPDRGAVCPPVGRGRGRGHGHGRGARSK